MGDTAAEIQQATSPPRPTEPMAGAPHPKASPANESEAPPAFQIPSELQDLEREPYHLDRYPSDFRLNDAAESFEALLRTVEDGNREEALVGFLLGGGGGGKDNQKEGAGGLVIDEEDSDSERGADDSRTSDDNDEDDDDDDDGDDARGDPANSSLSFIPRERFQALYTLVRKFTHLEPDAKRALLEALADAVGVHCRVLRDQARRCRNSSNSSSNKTEATVPQRVRDSFACHLYFLYMAVVLMESASSSSSSSGGHGGGDDDVNAHEKELALGQHRLRSRAMDSMAEACQAMIRYRNVLWQRGVVDEAVVLLPAKVAYRMLEKCRIVTARKLYCGDQALRILATVLDACGDDSLEASGSSSSSAESSIFTTVSATLMDLMHGFEHMAPMCCELCTSTLAQIRSSNNNNKNNDAYRASNDVLAIELLREVVRVASKARSQGGPDGLGAAAASTAKASGIAWVAPFIPLLAEARPHLALQQMPHLIVPLLQSSQAYNVRSAVVQAVKHVLDHLGKQQQKHHHLGEDGGEAGATGDQDGPGDSQSRSRASGGLADVTKSRDSLIALLMERAYDVSSYTRAAALRAMSQLVAGGTLPLKTHLLSVTQLAMDRLHDKTVVVRKQAMQLLTSLLENHPFLESLNPEPYRSKLQELFDWLKAHYPEAVQTAFDDGVQQLVSEEQDGSEGSVQREEAMMELEQGALAAAISEAETLLLGGSADPGVAVDVELTPEQQEYCTKVRALQFTQSALEFVAVLEDATTALESMLLSSNTSDVVEALRFFVQARHFDLPCAITGMKRALALLWSSEQAIRDEVIKSFIEVFIAVPGSDTQEPLPDQQITKNLLVLTAQATASELVSIEEAIQRLVLSEVIPPNVFLILWTLSSTGPSDTRAAAVRLLAMGAAADASVVDSKSRLKLLLAAGFGTYARKRRDWRLVEAASICLQRVERAKVDSTDAKYLVLELTLEQLQAVARGDWCNDTQKDTLEWFPAAEQAVKALFNISPEPEVVSRNVLLNMYKTTFSDPNSVHPLRLARFFHIVGQVSLQLLVYTEALCSSVRRVNAKKSLKRQEDADNAKTHKRSASGVSNGSDDNNIESELGVAAEVEAENERAMSEIAEKEIVGRNLIAQFGPLLARVVANEDALFGNVQILTQAAMLALVKLMSVSSKFCEDHLTLLFSALANAPPEDTTMRANTVVALGDLAFRFPNEVEPYTPHLYACLRDPSTKVRRHTLMVLTHLILNDMVRVKGQVCEIALCLRDDDPRIRDMSRLLFHELSKRTNNPIYNLLPDIISNLGQAGTTKKEDFRGIMTFLLGFIKKDRQNEMLVDKLCHRFPASTSTSQKADLAYCIAQLKMTDRTIKCLNDNYKLYKDALHDDDVYKSFASIIAKAKKKFTSGETSQLLEDWEAKIADAAIVGAENEDAEGKAVRASQKAGRKQQRKKKGAEFDAIMEEGDEEEEEEIERAGASATPPKGKKKAAPAKRSTRKKRPAAAKRVVVDDEDGASDNTATEDEFEFDAENDVGQANVRTRKKKESTRKASSRKANSSGRQRLTAAELSD